MRSGRSEDSPAFDYHPVIPAGGPEVAYRRLTDDLVAGASFSGARVLKVEREALRMIAGEAFRDIAHRLRPTHLAQLRAILADPEASENDRFVALDLLKNAVISAAGILPMCQDTGTAIIHGEKGQSVWTGVDDAAALAEGVHRVYREDNLRYSQLAPLDMYDEVNTGTNLPAQIDLSAVPGDTYRFLFIAKGGGSANKTFLYQQSAALLNPESLHAFLDERIRTLGTAACPPYHLAIVIGGMSAEMTLKTVKLASCRYLDHLPGQGNQHGQAFRDYGLEREVQRMTRHMGIGAQFGGKYFCHDVRVIRLPRHGGSCPVGLGVSCSADRQAVGKITAEGVFLEQLETDPARFLPEVDAGDLPGDVARIDLNRPMAEIREELGRLPVKARISLSGPMTVARDLAHAKLKAALDQGQDLPSYLKQHPIYYAGPAKTPEGMVSGAFGPTTSARMDSYVADFQRAGASLVMIGKGNRSPAVVEACRTHGGFYLGSVGGPGARLARDCIRSIELVDFPELGMEAVWRIDVEDFPAFIVIDDKGGDFFADFKIDATP
ncbi:MAG: fumarate hydratase [Alphaproteobacteria bacterium]